MGGLLIFAAASAHAAATNCARSPDFDRPQLCTGRMCVPRVGHTATLMPDGNILVAGGLYLDGTGTNCALDAFELSLQQQGQFLLSGQTMQVARSSHTATLLPNGMVFVAGGNIGTLGAPAGTAATELYDPTGNILGGNPGTWHAGPSMTAQGTGVAAANAGKRYNHTATLLKIGDVLLCGGENAAGQFLDKCDVYTPFGPECSTPIGCMNGAGTLTPSLHPQPTLLTARSNHTAVLLPDGRVWFAGGMNTTQTPQFINETEMYNPNSGNFTGAHGLNIARAYHRATVLGNGQVMLIGGMDGKIWDRGTRGYVDYPEIYDPQADNVIAAAPLGPDLSHTVRFMSPAVNLNGDGTVEVFGGLGNITTSYLAINPILDGSPGSLTSVLLSSAVGLGALGAPPIVDPGAPTASTQLQALNASVLKSGGQTLNAQLNFFLGTPVSGIIQDGGLYFSSPSVTLPGGGVVYYDTGDVNDHDLHGEPTINSGLFVNLAGTQVICDPKCGHIVGDFKITDFGGVADFSAIKTAVSQNTVPASPGANPGALDPWQRCDNGSGGAGANPFYVTPGPAPDTNQIYWTGLPLNSANGAQSLDPAHSGLPAMTVTLTGLPTYLSGAKLLGGSLQILNATVATTTSTITIAPTGFNGLYASSISYIDANGCQTAGNCTVSALGAVTISGVAFAQIEGTVNGLYAGTGGYPTPTPAKNDGYGISTDTETVDPAADGTKFAKCSRLFPNPQITGNINARLIFSQADISGLTLNTVNNSTVIIRSMIFDDLAKYNPKNNTWTYDSQGGGSGRFGGTATMAQTGSVQYLGGAGCTAGAAQPCPALHDRGSLSSSLNLTSVNSAVKLVGPWNGAGGLVTGRADHTATYLADGTILVAGGNGGTALNTSEIFNPLTKAFTQSLGLMKYARDLHTATLLPNSKVLAVGGFAGSSSAPANTAELYFPASQTWSLTANLSTGRDQHTATLLADGNLMVAGGYNIDSSGSKYVNSAEIYYATAAAWHTLTIPSSINTASGGAGACGNMGRARHTATLLQDGRVFFFGGINQNGVLNTGVIYDPKNAAGGSDWYCAASRVDGGGNRPSYLHSATLLQGGNVLITGGNDGRGEINNLFTNIYVPAAGAAGSWAVTVSSMNVPRYNHTATLLPNGLVMAIGGTQNSGAQAAVETFDPASGIWTSQASLNTARTQHSAILGMDGNVYVFGGVGTVAGQPFSYNLPTESLYFTASPDAQSINAPPSLRQSSITAVVPAYGPIANISYITQGGTLTVRGTNFLGLSEANGGGSASNSEHYHPRLVLQALGSSSGSSSQGESGNLVDLSTRVYNPVFFPGVTAFPTGQPVANLVQQNAWTGVHGTDIIPSSITVRIPSSDPGCSNVAGNDPCEATKTPPGWYQVRVANNAVFSNSQLVHLGPPFPSTPVSITASTVPFDAASSANPIYIQAGSSTIHYTWPDLVGVDGYNVYQSSTGIWLGSVPTNSPPGAGTIAFDQTQLSPNTTASITVAPFNMSGDGPLATSATTYSLSTAPVSVAISTLGFSDMYVTWNINNNNPGTFYEVTTSSDDPTSNGHLPFTTQISTPYSVVPFNNLLTTSTAHLTGLSSNTTYYVRVRAFNGSLLASNYSALSSATTLSPVFGLQGSPGIQCLVPAPTTCIFWQWNTVSAAIKYNVYNATSGVKIASVANAFFSDVNLATNTARAVTVSAVTAAGEGPLSGSVTYYTDAAVPLPFAPSYTNISTGAFTVQWIRNQNPPGTTFLVSVGTAPLGAVSGFQTTSFILTDPSNFLSTVTYPLSAGDIYIASVAAVNLGGRIQATVSGAPIFLSLGSTSTLVNPVANAQIAGVTPTSINLNWQSNGNASTATYIVAYSSDDLSGNGNAPFTTVVSTWIDFPARYNALSTVITGLQTSTTYHIRIYASNVFGNFSNFVALASATSNGGAAAGSLAGLIDPSNGGIVQGTLGDGHFVSMDVPGGAFPSQVQLVISTHDPAGTTCPSSDVPGAAKIGFTFQTNPQLEPVKPVVFLIRYRVPPEVIADEMAGFNPSRTVLYRYDSVAKKCIAEPTSIDTVNHLMIVRINHFSDYFRGILNPAATPDSAQAYPNPFFANTDGFMTIDNVPAGSRVRIFTMRGDLVYDRNADGTGTLIWPGINRAGRPVASGVYFAVIEAVGGPVYPRKILKIAVLR